MDVISRLIPEYQVFCRKKSGRCFIANLQYVAYLCNLCISASPEVTWKASTITQFNMRTDKNLICGQPYEAPTVTSLDILSEGLLCQSGMYDRADNGYGYGDDFDLGEI